ncbi:MAG: hypothetical protein H0X67_11395 [Acidobacteria bacterium]|nr:hypothetical protein [Acidobacteriota bacterium]
MDFREYASHETSAVVSRLLTSQADAQIRRAREALDLAARELDTSVAPVGAEDEIRDLVQRIEAAAGIAVQRVQQEAQKTLHAVGEELAAARREAADANLVVTTLRGEVAALVDRAGTAEADLDATIEAHRQIEMELGGLRELLEGSRAEATRLTAELEAGHAERGLLVETLAAARELQARVESALTAAESAVAEGADSRATLQEELDAARARVTTLEEARAALQADLETSQAALRASETEVDATRAALAEAEANLETSRTALNRAESERDALGGALKAAEAERDRMTLLEAAASACRELGAADSMSGLLEMLVSQVSKQFTRAAIFRVKAHHLEGEHAVGFDAATDVSKLIIPLTLDSLVTRAHASGAFARLGPGDGSAGPAPFDGSPHVAIAVPITFQGDILAVLYADSDDPAAGPHEERPAFASVLAGHATVLLGRMSQELKTLQELRDYASMLLQEAQQMYAADVESGRGEAERRRRLQDTLDCARQLYAQRAALEGSAAAGLLDEQIAAAITAAPDTPFTEDLALAAGHGENARRSAS